MGQWITIGAKEEGGKKRGGSPVYVENGRITKGAPSLTGKRIDAMLGPAEGFGVRASNKMGSEYAKASVLKEAKRAGIGQHEVKQLAAEIVAHDHESKGQIAKMLGYVRHAYPQTRSLTASAGRGNDWTSVKHIDLIAKDVSNNGDYAHLFPQGIDPIEHLFDLLSSGNPEKISEAQAYHEAFDSLKSQAPAAHAEFKTEDEMVPFADTEDLELYTTPPEPVQASSESPELYADVWHGVIPLDPKRHEAVLAGLKVKYPGMQDIEHTAGKIARGHSLMSRPTDVGSHSDAVGFAQSLGGKMFTNDHLHAIADHLGVPREERYRPLAKEYTAKMQSADIANGQVRHAIFRHISQANQQAFRQPHEDWDRIAGPDKEGNSTWQHPSSESPVPFTEWARPHGQGEVVNTGPTMETQRTPQQLSKHESNLGHVGWYNTASGETQFAPANKPPASTKPVVEPEPPAPESAFDEGTPWNPEEDAGGGGLMDEPSLNEHSEPRSVGPLKPPGPPDKERIFGGMFDFQFKPERDPAAYAQGRAVTMEEYAALVSPEAYGEGFRPLEHDKWKNLEAHPDYHYHATNMDNLGSIAKSHLKTHRPDYGTDQDSWPDGSTEKRSYFSTQPSSAYYFAPEEGPHVLLRVHHTAANFKRESTGDIYSKEKIAAKHFEAVGHDGKWVNIGDMKPETYDRGPHGAEHAAAHWPDALTDIGFTHQHAAALTGWAKKTAQAAPGVAKAIGTAAGKAEHGIVSAVGRSVNALPDPIATSIKTAWDLAWSSHAPLQHFARHIMDERGMTPEQVDQLHASTVSHDSKIGAGLFKAPLFGAPLESAAASYLPWASLGYIAKSAVTNPMAVLRAVKNRTLPALGRALKRAPAYLAKTARDLIPVSDETLGKLVPPAGKPQQYGAAVTMEEYARLFESPERYDRERESKLLRKLTQTQPDWSPGERAVVAEHIDHAQHFGLHTEPVNPDHFTKALYDDRSLGKKHLQAVAGYLGADIGQARGRGDVVQAIGERIQAMNAASIQRKADIERLIGPTDPERLGVVLPRGSLGIPRAQMPQIPKEHLADFAKSLQGEGISAEFTKVPAGHLKPTQGEIDAAKIHKNATKSDKKRDRGTTIISSDDRVIDGHHKGFATLVAKGPAHPVNALRIGLPAREALDKAIAYHQQIGGQSKGVGAEAYALLTVGNRSIDDSAHEIWPHLFPKIPYRGSAHHFHKIIGVPEEAKIDVYRMGPHGLSFSGSSPEISNIHRELRFHPGGRKSIYNASFFLNDGHEGKGLGTDIFANQVSHAVEHGFHDIHTSAIRSAADRHGRHGANGYYTWPLLGYNGELRNDHRSRLSPPYNRVKTIHELFDMPGGREEWKKNGKSISLDFDLSPGSPHIERLNRYLEEKGKPLVVHDMTQKPQKTGSPQQYVAEQEPVHGPVHGPGDTPDFSAEEIAAMERIVDKHVDPNHPLLRKDQP